MRFGPDQPAPDVRSGNMFHAGTGPRALPSNDRLYVESGDDEQCDDGDDEDLHPGQEARRVPVDPPEQLVRVVRLRLGCV